jgi:hypothetical protein
MGDYNPKKVPPDAIIRPIFLGCVSTEKVYKLSYESTVSKHFLIDSFPFGVIEQTFLKQSSDCAKPEVRENDAIDFYQDEKKECYLFSKNVSDIVKIRQKKMNDMDEELRQKLGREFSREYQGILRSLIIAVDKDGIIVLTEEEFEKLKPTLKPHTFDESLCKSKPKGDCRIKNFLYLD